jgi:hypothetical protein
MAAARRDHHPKRAVVSGEDARIGPRGHRRQFGVVVALGDEADRCRRERLAGARVTNLAAQHHAARQREIDLLLDRPLRPLRRLAHREVRLTRRRVDRDDVGLAGVGVDRELALRVGPGVRLHADDAPVASWYDVTQTEAPRGLSGSAATTTPDLRGGDRLKVRSFAGLDDDLLRATASSSTRR